MIDRVLIVNTKSATDTVNFVLLTITEISVICTMQTTMLIALIIQTDIQCSPM